MPVSINGERYFRTAEVQRMVGLSRNTLFRWTKEGVLGVSELRDRRGWRLFTHNNVETLKEEANRLNVVRNSE
jgi:DNA-binding transcriptional MerR regulator